MQQQQMMIAARQIVPGNNPRTFFDPAEMEELQASVKAQEVLQPLLVRPIDDGKFQIIAGERRYRAHMAVFGGDVEIPVMSREMDDAAADEAALIENIQRANMSPTEEAVAAAKILGRCAGDRDEASRRLGWTRSTLDKRLALMNCSDKVKVALNERKISLGHAELMAAVQKEMQDKALERFLAMPTLPTVTEMKNMINQLARSLETAIFCKEGCAGCPFNSATQQALFSEAIADGNCTNGECFDKKTSAELDARAESLKEEFPLVRIIKPGENFTVLPLKTQGVAAITEEQATACRGCANFGGAVSSLPGSIGNIYRNQCFDPACHSQKVAERIQAEKAAEKAKTKEAKEAGKTAGEGATASTPAAKTEPKAAASVQDSNRVKEYRVKVWREALKKELFQDPGKNLIALVALAMTGKGMHIDASKLREVFSSLGGTGSSATDVKATCQGLADLEAKQLTMMHQGIVATASAKIEEQSVVQFLQWLEVDLSKHWQLNKEYLELLTKSEMDAIAAEIGLKAHMGKEFSKLIGGKKDEAIKGLLSVSDFEYKGKVPNNMRWSSK